MGNNLPIGISLYFRVIQINDRYREILAKDELNYSKSFDYAYSYYDEFFIKDRKLYSSLDEFFIEFFEELCKIMQQQKKLNY